MFRFLNLEEKSLGLEIQILGLEIGGNRSEIVL